MPHTTQNSQQAGVEEIFTLLDPSGNSTPATRSTTHPPTPAPMSTTQPTSSHVNPKDDETPDESASEAQQFSKAINKLVKIGSLSNPNSENLTLLMVPTPEN